MVIIIEKKRKSIFKCWHLFLRQNTLRRFVYRKDGSESGMSPIIIWLYKNQNKKAAWLVSVTKTETFTIILQKLLGYKDMVDTPRVKLCKLEEMI